MKDELIFKIQGVLSQPITQEMQVVYLLVELRKLMDREAYQDSVLRMFCNWVVHTKLERRAEGSEIILTEFDEIITGLLERNAARTTHFEHLSFDKFRKALARCFDAFNLSAPFIREDGKYVEFVHLYSSVLGECPIVFSASKTPLKHVEKIELQGFCEGILVNELPVLQWRITLNDGNTMEWGFHMA
jgi:hypothetical protein